MPSIIKTTYRYDRLAQLQQDPQGTYLARVVFPKPVHYFSVTVDLVAEMPVINPFYFFLEPSAEKIPCVYSDDLRGELAAFLRAKGNHFIRHVSDNTCCRSLRSRRYASVCHSPPTSRPFAALQLQPTAAGPDRSSNSHDSAFGERLGSRLTIAVCRSPM